jgi:hypothetical protein
VETAAQAVSQAQAATVATQELAVKVLVDSQVYQVQAVIQVHQALVGSVVYLAPWATQDYPDKAAQAATVA